MSSRCEPSKMHLNELKALAARKKTILKSIADQNLLTDELRRRVEDCPDLRTLEAILFALQTEATHAGDDRSRARAWPLADLLLRQEPLNQSKQTTLKPYVDPALGVPDSDAALEGALDIVAEVWSEDAETRQWLADQATKFGKVSAKVKRGKRNAEGAEKFDQYFDRQESVRRIPGHRVLAMLRGAAEGILNVGVELDGSREVSDLRRRLVRNHQFEFAHELAECVEDCYERLLMPATASTVLAQLKEEGGRRGNHRFCKEPA